MSSVTEYRIKSNNIYLSFYYEAQIIKLIIHFISRRHSRHNLIHILLIMFINVDMILMHKIVGCHFLFCFTECLGKYFDIGITQ